MDRLDEIAARLRAATPGPWRELYEDIGEDERILAGVGYDESFEAHSTLLIIPDPDRDDDTTEADMALIAHAPADLAFLLEQIALRDAALKAQAAEYEAEIAGLRREIEEHKAEW